MVRCFVAAVVCSGSVCLAGASWSDARWAAQGGATNQSAAATAGEVADAAATSDVSDVIGSIVSTKAGRSVTRISAGLTGDWANLPAANTTANVAVAVADGALAGQIPQIYPPAAPIDLDVAQAVAVPLPPALLASVPGLLLAYFARRCFAN